MRNATSLLAFAAVTGLFLTPIKPAHAQWVTDSVSYTNLPSRDQLPAGTTYTVSAARPDISAHAEVFCSGVGFASLHLDGVIGNQSFKWQGTGDPTNLAFIVTRYADASASNGTAVYGVSRARAEGASYPNKAYADVSAPPDGSDSGNPVLFVYAPFPGETTKGFDFGLRTDADASVTSGCVEYPNASGSATAKAWHVISVQ